VCNFDKKRKQHRSQYHKRALYPIHVFEKAYDFVIWGSFLIIVRIVKTFGNL